MPANFENSAVSTGLEKSVFIPIPKKGNAKVCSNYHIIALIPHTSKVMLKILQTRLQQYMNHELPDAQAGFRKCRQTRHQITNIHYIMKKQESFKKIYTSALLTMTKPLCGSQKTVENSSIDGDKRLPYLPPEKSVCRSRSKS